MSPTVDEFLDCLGASGLLARQELAELRSHAQNTPGGATASLLAAELVERSRLTGFQTRELLAGRAHGLQIGGYELLDELPRAGACRWFRARRTSDGHPVRIRTSETIEGMPLAHRSAADIGGQHPALPRLLDAFHDSGTHYLVIDEIDAEDLRSVVLQQGALPPELAIDCLFDVVNALEEVFGAGFSCSVAPEHLLLEADGRIRLVGLGLGSEDLSADAAGQGTIAAPGGPPDASAIVPGGVCEELARLFALLVIGDEAQAAASNGHGTVLPESHEWASSSAGRILRRLRRSAAAGGRTSAAELRAHLESCLRDDACEAIDAPPPARPESEAITGAWAADTGSAIGTCPEVGAGPAIDAIGRGVEPASARRSRATYFGWAAAAAMAAVAALLAWQWLAR